MTDNAPKPEGTSPSIPPAKKGPGGKIVVMLSSVAKPAPGSFVVEAEPPKTVVRPPPLPAKSSEPVRALPLPGTKAKPPPLPVKTAADPVKIEAKKAEIKTVPPIKLNPSSLGTASSGESIFADADTPAAPTESVPQGWKKLEPGELEPFEGDFNSLDVFGLKPNTKSVEVPPGLIPETKPEEKKEGPAPIPSAPAPLIETKVPPVPEIKPEEKKEGPAPIPSAPAPLIETKAPPVPDTKPEEKKKEEPQPITVVAKPKGPPPLPVLKPATPQVVHQAPPLLEKSPAQVAEKLPAPHLPDEAGKEEPAPKPAELSEASGAPKAPAMLKSEPPAVVNKQPVLPSKAVTGPIILRQGPAPVALPTVAKPKEPESIKVVDAKPALRPPVLPSKALVQPKPVEADKTPVPIEPAKKVAKVKPAEKMPAIVPAAPAKKAPLPLTRVERAHRRRVVETVTFYVVLAVTGILLFVGGLRFGRETILEGQVIPPTGMTLGNEVWIVGDFRMQASGVAEDLAADRTPLRQEIQERLDHFQHVQGDIAARDERIRLLQQQIQNSKDEVIGIVKQARDATQQLWDGPGADLDNEYNDRLDQLGQAIADRAKSLNLNYQPDETYHSPEVWANAYRLALYGITGKVDGAKELQWLGDQMKQWRDYQKSIDDKKEALREKAAQLKLDPAPKITDLNNKIEDLQHHIDSTLAEEEPLKAELQQAQTDLATAQANEAGLDDKYYKQLYALPEGNITDRLSLRNNGRFTWNDLERNKPFLEGESVHYYWIFARATRMSDNRQYWALGRIGLRKNENLQMVIEPDGFVSTKSILRPDLSPDEQAQ
ncbi:MAG: hypothetical protein LV479_12710 [Methylacidiphilales bacterium]|nr:hypothetical protein [Candidatus Methylacidiphilales bacterium]